MARMYNRTCTSVYQVVRLQNQENGMRVVQNKRVSGYLFIASGCVFFLGALVGLIGKQVSLCTMFAGLGCMFVAIGIAYLRRVKGQYR